MAIVAACAAACLANQQRPVAAAVAGRLDRRVVRTRNGNLGLRLRRQLRAHLPAGRRPGDSTLAKVLAGGVDKRRLDPLRDDARSTPSRALPCVHLVISDALDHLWVAEYEVPGEERDLGVVDRSEQRCLDVKSKGRTYRDPWSGLAVNEAVQTGVALHLRVTANHAPTSTPDSNRDEPTSSHVARGAA